ncbi:MAG: hypothetical protein M3Q07_12380 [Pseudobdellovibrionaceae bacterium]|nr:hypothetical protein [Pseudobdellovibrionaceae bacterium]
MTSVKKVDPQGRLTIPELSGAQVIIEAISEHEFRVRRVEVIPAEEAWLFKNPTATAAVQAGLADAIAGMFSDDPRIGKDYSWLDNVEDE